jgi:hypothetical protein
VIETDASQWLRQGHERQRVFMALSQPLTAHQLALRLEKSRNAISECLRQLRIFRLAVCLNPSAHQSRVYTLTDEGRAHLALFAQEAGLSVPAIPELAWDLYGDLCFRHRRAVLVTLRGRVRPPQVKRYALGNDPMLRMSVDNCREVLYWMVANGVVRAVRPRGSAFPSYELTEVGRRFQAVMRRGSDPGTWVTVVSGHMGDTRA